MTEFQTLAAYSKAFFTAARTGAIILAVSILPAQAFVPAPPPSGPPPTIDPQPSPKIGPSLPYISGRLGGAQQAPSSAPTGNVVPDDFCLPGKLDDCGSHLREEGEAIAVVQDEGPVFVGGVVGNEDLAFFQAKNSAWANGSFRQTNLNGGAEQRDLTSYSLGADRHFGDRLVFGAMIVNSSGSSTFSGSNIEDASNGFYAGPYFAFEMSENIFLDGRFVAGNSDHTIRTSGATTGQYQSFDAFAAVRVSGKFTRNNWRFYPALEFARTLQNSDAYADTLRGAIPSNSASDTFLTATLLGYYDGMSGGMTPYGGVEISQDLGNGGTFATVRAGFNLAVNNGSVLNVDYAHGAIGLSNTTDQQISLRFEIPF